MNTPSRTHLSVTALVAVLSLALAACGGPADPDPDATEPDATEPDASEPGASTDVLDGDWQLIDGTGPDGPLTIPAGAVITLTIDGDSWGGTAACNSYGGTVVVDGDDVSIGQLAVTEMACLEDALMDAEAAYLAALTSVDTVAGDGDRLTLTGPSASLTFEPVAPVAAAPLVGTEWRLEAVIDAPTGEDGDTSVSSTFGDATLEIAGDGSVAGSTGCNRFMGDLEVDGNSWRAGPLAGTRMACDDALTRQEEHVFAVLDGTATIELDADTLTIIGEDGRGLIYRAAS